MRLRECEDGELMVAGVRCTQCERWVAVAEGNVVPWCCSVSDLTTGLVLEHRPAEALQRELREEEQR